MIATGNQSLPRFAQAAKYYPEIPLICKKKNPYVLPSSDIPPT